MMSPTHKVFQDLAGIWTLRRTIHDQGDVSGQVVFTRLDNGSLRYMETGILSINAGQFEAKRSYIYTLGSGSITVTYDDPERHGGILHELVFRAINGASEARHTHHCGEDVYGLVFRQHASRCIEMIYDVAGPNKSYTMTSWLTPGTSSPSAGPAR